MGVSETLKRIFESKATVISVSEARSRWEKDMAPPTAGERTLYPEPVPSTQGDVLQYLSNKPTGIIIMHGKAGSVKSYLIRKIETRHS